MHKTLEQGDLTSARATVSELRKDYAASLQLAAEVFHELRQPLLGVKAYAQMIQEEGKQGSPANLLLGQIERMEQILSDFTRLAADRPAAKERLELGHHVQEAVRLFQLSAESARVQLEVDVASDAELVGNGRLLEQLVLNLLNNARDAMRGLGRIKVVLEREGPRPVLYVADWGPGVPPEIRERIFEPYVSSRPKGNGLGLAVCKRIAAEHHAHISLAPPTVLSETPPPATVFRVLFAAVEGAAAEQKKRILVVDDEVIIRMVFKDLMGRECEVIEAETAEEALSALRGGAFDLMVTDKNLPGLSGLDLAQEARRLNPDSKVILMTGYPSLVTAQQAIELGVLDYLLKPFDDIRTVRETLRAALSAAAPSPRTATTKRIDVYEDNPASARQISEALTLLGLEPHLLTTPTPYGEPPAAVVVSWDFGPAHGPKAIELAKAAARGSPFVVLAEHLTMDSALASLRGGATACLPKLLTDVKALSRELSRALKLSP